LLFVLVLLFVCVTASNVPAFHIFHPESQVPFILQIGTNDGPYFPFTFSFVGFGNGNFHQESFAYYGYHWNGGNPYWTLDAIRYYYEPDIYYSLSPFGGMYFNSYLVGYGGFYNPEFLPFPFFEGVFVEPVFAEEGLDFGFGSVYLGNYPEYLLFYAFTEVPFRYDFINDELLTLPGIKTVKMDNSGWLLDFVSIYNDRGYDIVMTIDNLGNYYDFIDDEIRYRAIDTFQSRSRFRNPNYYFDSYLYSYFGTQYYGDYYDLTPLDRWFIPFVYPFLELHGNNQGHGLKPIDFPVTENYFHFNYYGVGLIVAEGSQLDNLEHYFFVPVESEGDYYVPAFYFSKTFVIPSGEERNWLTIFKVFDPATLPEYESWRYPYGPEYINPINPIYPNGQPEGPYYSFRIPEPNAYYAVKLAHDFLDSEKQMYYFESRNNFLLLGFLDYWDLYYTVNWDFSFLTDNVCGDGECTLLGNNPENAENCPADCFCGDTVCDPTEDALYCGRDCLSVCGNGICEEYEFYFNSCGDCDSCGDGVCDEWENPFDCPDDCTGFPFYLYGDIVCGDGICDYPFEDHDSCHHDCFYGNLCGDDFCDPFEFVTCPYDCPHPHGYAGN